MCYFNDPFKSYHSENLLRVYKMHMHISLSPHLISMLDHHHSSRIERSNYSRKYNYILIRFDINYRQIVFPPGCEKLSLETGGKNYYDFAETKTLQFNRFNTKASFMMKPHRYNVNEKSFPIKYLIPSISVYKK